MLHSTWLRDIEKPFRVSAGDFYFHAFRMLLKRKDFEPCNIMGKSVSPAKPRKPATNQRQPASEPSLYAATDGTAGRKYLNHDERQRVLAAAQVLPPRSALFALTLAWTGGRISEVLALTPRSFQVEHSLVAFITLKRRRWSVREVPIPPTLMRELAAEFALATAQQDQAHCNDRLWPMSRATAWRIIKRVMETAQVSGRCASPRGLRHAYGVGILRAGIPVTLLQRWMGHARLTTTAIYTCVSGPDEFAMARRFWES